MERMKTQVELLKECCDIKDAACVRYQKRIAELEKENENLNKHLGEKIDTIQVLIREKYEEKGEKLELLKENKNLNIIIENTKIEQEADRKYIEELEEENKKLRAYADNLDSENDNQAIEIEELKKENKKLKKYYDRDKEELMESCYGLAKENDELKKKTKLFEGEYKHIPKKL